MRQFIYDRSGFLSLHPQSENILAELKACLDNSREYFAETEFIDSNHQRIPVEVGGTGFAINGDKYILGSFRDITDRKKAEQSLRTAQDELGHRIEERTKREGGRVFRLQRLATAQQCWS